MYRVIEGGEPLPAPAPRLARAARLPRRRRRRTASSPGRPTRPALLAFSAFTMLVTYAIQRLQHVLPFNPQKLGPVEAGSAFNTAASFTTNTNWQGYVGRDHDELPQPDGRPRLAQLHLRRRRHRDRGGARPRAHPARRRQGPGHDRQLLGGPHAGHGLHPAADLRRLRSGLRLAGDDPEPRSLPRGARRSRAPSR